MHLKLTLRASALAAAVLLAACHDPLAPFQPEIANAAGTFQFQTTGMTGVTVARDYAWVSTKQTANVNVSSALSGGTATLTILDETSKQVWSGNLATNGTFTTAAGTSAAGGAWVIRIQFSNVRGTVNFRVQNP